MDSDTFLKELLIFTLGGLMGIVTGTAIQQSWGNPFSTAEIFQREEGERTVMRLYRRANISEHDILFVEADNPQLYTSLSQYLETIKDPYERRIEQAKIERVVRGEEK